MTTTQGDDAITEEAVRLGGALFATAVAHGLELKEAGRSPEEMTEVISGALAATVMLFSDNHQDATVARLVRDAERGGGDDYWGRIHQAIRRIVVSMRPHAAAVLPRRQSGDRDAHGGDAEGSDE